MDETQLILQLKELKSVSPRQEWVSLTKTQLFAGKAIAPKKAGFAGFAYAFAALLVVIAGTYGMMNLPAGSTSKNSAASLVAENNLKSSVDAFKIKSQNLSVASLAKAKDISIVVKEVKEAAKNITETLKKDPELAGKVALDINNNKTYLDVAGGNSSSEVSDMYKTIVVQMIKDLDGTTLTKDQQTELARIKASLEKNGDYAIALRDILLISRTGASK